MKKTSISFVTLWDMNKGAVVVKEARYTLPPKEALIAGIMQYRGNYNTADYPKDIDGIYKSNVVKNRFLYDITDNLIISSQPA